MLDPSKWYVTFEEQKIPAGTIAEKDWSVTQINYASSGNAYALVHGNASDESKFITPLLKVEEGDVLTFEVGRPNKTTTYSTLNVYYSTDRTNWTLAKEIAGTELSSSSLTGSSYGSYSSFGKPTEFTLDNIPAGEYYIAFGAKYVYIDNLYGFTPVDVAHDWAITANNLPKSGVVNNAYTGTVTLQNINLKDEEAGTYTAKLFVDDEAVAEAEAVTIAAGESATFDFTFTPHAVGAHKAYVVFENAADAYSVTSDTVSVTIAEESANEDVASHEATSTGNTPLTTNYKNSASESIYDAELLAAAGLQKGDKITRLYYKGYNTNADLDVNAHSRRPPR